MYVDLSYNRLAGLYSRCLASLQIILNLVYLRVEPRTAGEDREGGGRSVKAGYFLLGHAAYELHTQKFE